MKSKWTGVGAVGAGVGVALSWLCCLPFAAALGAGVVAAGALLTPFQPYFALASVLLLFVAFVQTVREQRCEDGVGCSPVSRKRRWIFLAAIGAVTLLLLTIPYWSAPIVFWSL